MKKKDIPKTQTTRLMSSFGSVFVITAQPNLPIPLKQ